MEKSGANVFSENADNIVDMIEKIAHLQEDNDYIIANEYIEAITSKLKDATKKDEPSPRNTNPHRWFQTHQRMRQQFTPKKRLNLRKKEHFPLPQIIPISRSRPSRHPERSEG